MGEPKFGTKIGNNVMTDTRKIGNPNARDFYTYGKRQEIRNGRATNTTRTS